MLEKRKLGNTGLLISPIVFGGNVFGWTADRETSFALLDRFFESGGNLVDTADTYSRWAPGNTGGESEAIIGEWLATRKNRSRVLIASKVGMESAPGEKGLSKAHIMKSVDLSLKRLQTDYIDLYQSHVDDASTPIEETLGAYEQLRKEGKIRFVGSSNFSAVRLGESIRVASRTGLPRYETAQPLFNLIDRHSFEGGLQEFCKSADVGVLTYSSLASGFLSGKYKTEDDVLESARAKALAAYLTPKSIATLASVTKIAERHGVTAAEVAIAWVVAQPAVTAAIVSATNIGQLDALMSGAGLALTDEDLRELA